jgi:hypothetical protein
MISREHIASVLSDVRFWIGVFFILHLSTITLPPLEPGSTWRQTDGYMIARNFYEIDSNILYPRVDMLGDKSGIVGCEFPIINYLVYLLSLVFGFHSWFGRLINLTVSSVGVYFLYRLINEYFGKQAAFNTAIIVLSSIWFTYNRTNIPDTFGASLCITSLYFGTRYLRDQRSLDLGIFLIAGMIGCLSRISAAVILPLIAIPFLYGKTTANARIMTTLVALLILAAVCTWYFIWVPYLNATFDSSGHFFMGMTFTEGAKLLVSDIPLLLKRFYETPMKYTAFLVFLGSLVYAIRSRNRMVLAVFLIPFVAYSIMIFRIAEGLKIDAYYMIMYMLPMAFVAGWGLSQLKKKTVIVVFLMAIGIEGVANQIHVFAIRQPYKSLEELEVVMDSVSKRTDLIAISGLGPHDPTELFMAHRRGWTSDNETLANPEYQNAVKSAGCVYIVIVKKVFGDLELHLPKIYDSEFFTVYKL